MGHAKLLPVTAVHICGMLPGERPCLLVLYNLNIKVGGQWVRGRYILVVVLHWNVRNAAPTSTVEQLWVYKAESLVCLVISVVL